MSHLDQFYAASSGMKLAVEKTKPEFRNITIKKCSMSNKTIFRNELMNEKIPNEYNANRSQSHLVNSTIDIQALPDVFNSSISSSNDKTPGNKTSSRPLYSNRYKLIFDKRVKKNQSSSTVRCCKVIVKHKLIEFDNSIDQNVVIDPYKSPFNLREARMVNDRKQQYLAYVEENRKQTRKIYVLNHGDRKYRVDLRNSYNPYYV